MLTQHSCASLWDVGKKDNLLVIEFKKSSSRIDRAKDFNKLHAYKNNLDYKYSLFIELGAGKIDSAVTSVSWI
ncbi:TPA: hypothetical protein RUX01_003213 [Aeromonas dhakensis]|nr:hypothetical protein [Aeromonas dhakensis]